MKGEEAWRPKLVDRAVLHFDQVGNQEMLLFPEAGLILNETAAAILRLCQGNYSIEQIIDLLSQHFEKIDRAALAAEVLDFIESIRARGLLN